MNLRLMNIYCRVVDHGVMARAADELGMTAAAVTRAIADLEQALGARLLQRTTRRLQVTDAGRLYYEASRRLLEQVEELHDQFGQMREVVRGRLRISAPVSFGLSRLPETMGRFHTLFPDVELDVHLEDRAIDLIQEGFDLAIRIQLTMKDSSLIARPFGEFRICAVATRAYLDESAPIRKPADLQGHRFLAYSLSSQPNRLNFTGAKGRTNVSFKPTLQVNNSLMLKALVMQHHGIGIFPEFLVEDEISTGKLEQILPRFSLGSAKGWIVYPSRKYTPAPVTAFADFFTGQRHPRARSPASGTR